MKKITLILSAMLVALSISARSFEGKSVTLTKNAKTAELRQLDAAPSVKKAPAMVIEGWTELGEATVTESFGALFGEDEETYQTTVYKSNTTAGLYAIDNEWYDGEEKSDSIIQIHAEDPELCYILPTNLCFTKETYGYLATMNLGGRYVNAYPSYTPAQIAAQIGSGTDTWGKKVKNVITFSEDCMSACLTAYKSGQPGYFLGKRFIVELPDVEAPVITAVNNSFVGATKAIVEIVANDDVDVVDSLTFTVKNGDAVLVANGKTTNGKLTLEGLTKSTAYNLTLIATDRSGKASEAFAFSFTTVESEDTQAPTLAKAEIKEISDKWATISVEASDNESTAAEIVFVVTFADESSIELAANEGAIKLENLSPVTAYAIKVAAKDKAGNVSEAKSLNFTTLELIPIVMNIDWVQAQYFADYSEEGAQNYEISFWEGDDNYVMFDTYLPKEHAISGTYNMAGGYIGTQYSYIKYAGSKINITAAEISLEIVSLGEDGLGTYKTSFQAMGEDGNLYKGAVEIEVYSYIKSGSSSSIYAMSNEVITPTAVEAVKAEGNAVKRIVNGQVVIEKNGVFYNLLGSEIK